MLEGTYDAEQVVHIFVLQFATFPFVQLPVKAPSPLGHLLICCD